MRGLVKLIGSWNDAFFVYPTLLDRLSGDEVEELKDILRRAWDALRWIPINADSEKPKEDESVLLYGNHEWGTFFTVGHYSPDSDSWHYDDGTPCSPTYWMRAPEAPEGK